jgi:hypothetical protein
MTRAVLERAVQMHEEIYRKIQALKDNTRTLKRLGSLNLDQQASLKEFNDELVFEIEQLAVYSKIISENASQESKNSKTFRKADKEIIVKVTGIDVADGTTPRFWNIEAGVDTGVVPSAMFAELFEKNSSTFHMRTEAGRRTVLDLFLRDIVHREEFRRGLRIFPEMEFEVQSVNESAEPMKLSGIADYTIGHHANKGLFEPEPDKELHLVAVEAKRDWAEDSYWQYVAQVAALYKSRKDVGKEICRVWGIISNATHWKFVSINDQGLLSESKEYVISLHTCNDDTITLYRIIHHLVTLCFNASPPPTPVDNVAERTQGRLKRALKQLRQSENV